VSIPVIAVCNIKEPSIAEELLAEGVCDLVGVGRALLADSDWCKKAFSGREDEIRKCIGCSLLVDPDGARSERALWRSRGSNALCGHPFGAAPGSRNSSSSPRSAKNAIRNATTNWDRRGRSARMRRAVRMPYSSMCRNFFKPKSIAWSGRDGTVPCGREDSRNMSAITGRPAATDSPPVTLTALVLVAICARLEVTAPCAPCTGLTNEPENAPEA
jgi:hypothetical protein